jgi:hypothetical protein
MDSAPGTTSHEPSHPQPAAPELDQDSRSAERRRLAPAGERRDDPRGRAPLSITRLDGQRLVRASPPLPLLLVQHPARSASVPNPVAATGATAMMVGMGMIDGRLLRASASGVVPVCGVRGCSDGGVIGGVAVVGVWVGV